MADDVTKDLTAPLGSAEPEIASIVSAILDLILFDSLFSMPSQLTPPSSKTSLTNMITRSSPMMMNSYS